jgi:hypothetical protein
VVIVGTIFRQKFADVYSTRQALLNAIYAKAKSLADAAQSSGSLSRPIELWPNLAGQAVVTLTDGMEGTTALRMFVQASANDGTYHPVDPSRKYKTRFWARAASGTNGILYFCLRQFLDSAGTTCATNNGRSPYYPSGVAAHTGWVFYEHTWQGSDFQSGVKFVQPEYLGNYAGTTGYWEIQGFRWSDVTEVDAAQSTGDSAQSGVNTINDPDTLTTGEKPQIILDYNAVTGENADLVAKANAYGVDHSTYDTAYSALLSYLGTLTSPTAWNSLSGTTSLGTGNRAALWNPKWAAVKNAAANLRNAIAVGTAQNAISTAATDATNKANAAQLASQPHQVAWAYASKPALPNPDYPPGYYAITTDSRTVQVNAAGTAWTDVLVATTGLFGQLFAKQLTLTNFENLIPNPTSEMDLTNAPAGSIEAAGVSSATAYTGSKCRALAGNASSNNLVITPSIPVRVGESYYCECYATQTQATTGSTGNRLVVRFYNAAGSQVSVYATPYGQSQGTSWTKVFGSFVVPATAVTMTLELYSTSVPVGQTSYFDDLLLKRMADAYMIVDGTLQALVTKTPLLYSLDMRSGSDASGYTPGTATTPPIGFRISANGFTSTLLGGATFTAQVELGYGVNLMGYQLSGLTARSMSAIGDNGQTGTSFRCFYRGNNDPGTNGSRPNISRLTVTPTLYQTASPYTGRLDLKLAPSSYTDNLDGLSYAKIELFIQSAAGTSATLTTRGVYYCPLPDRIYSNPTSDSDAGNVSYATQVIAETGLSGVPACKVTLYGVAGSSDTHCFYAASGWTVGTALTDNGTAWPSGITGASGGGTGSGTGGGLCPAPDVPLLMADGTEKPAGVIRIGDHVVAWDEAAGCECVEEVTHAVMSTNHRWLLVLSNGRTGRFAANHRFLLSDGRWQELQHLAPGDVLTSGLVVESARPDVYGPVVKITVNRVHTYITLGVVSHNIKIQS